MRKSYVAKIAVVTGGASGIGRALGEALAVRGAHVVLADVNEAGAREVAEGIARAGGQAEAAQVDVSDGAAVEALVTRVATAHGRLDFMFNNAGIAIVGDAAQMSIVHWDRLIDVNVRGVVHGTVAAYTRMRAQGHGHIVNTASVAGLLPAPHFVAYGMTKHAVVGLSTGLRIEAERHGVRVSVVCPGLIETPMARNAQVIGYDIEEARKAVPISFTPAPECARQILDGVARNDAVIVVTRFAKALHVLYRLAPSITSALIQRELTRQMDRLGIR